MSGAYSPVLVTVVLTRALVGAVADVARERSCSQSEAVAHLLDLGLAMKASLEAGRGGQ